MADRTNVQLVIHDVRADDAPTLSKIREIIEEYDLLSYGAPETREHEHGLELGGIYGGNQVLCGSSAEINDVLCGLETVAFTVWEDPVYEYLGDLFRCVPGLGSFNAECDPNGVAVFTAAEIELAVRTNRVPELIGTAWQAAIDDIAANRPVGLVLPWPTPE